MIKKIIGFLTLLISLNTVAQRNNISPYSFFGIGENTNARTVEEIGMGQIGGSFNSTYQLSFTNPASYASLRLTTFAIAAENTGLQIDDGTNNERASSASFSYLALGFPISKNAGVAFGIQPNTTVGYSLNQEITDGDGNLTQTNRFTGEGGTNRVFLGLGYKIGRNFNLGVEASYVFGSIENNLLNRRDGIPLATLDKSDSDVSGLILKSGAQYHTKISEKLTLKSGVVLDLSNKVTNRGANYLISTENLQDPRPIDHKDTLSVRSINQTIKAPLKTILSTGIGQENKWYAGVEYEFQDALTIDDLLSVNDRTYDYGKSDRISLGGFYTPKYNSITSYWQRATYRAGLAFKRTGLIVSGTEVNDFGISFGVGLPMSKQLSNINLGFELGTRGEATNGLVKENYFNFRLGLSLSDKWFRKRKLD